VTGPAPAVPLRIVLHTVEHGRAVVRTITWDAPAAGTFLRRIELLAGDDRILSLPLGMSDWDDEDQADDEDPDE